MLTGCLIAESLRVGGALFGVPLSITRIRRDEAPGGTADQPPHWTILEFEAPDDTAEGLGAAFATCLDERGGWYTNFNTPDEAFVVFAGRVFRYPHGDTVGRAEAADYARSVGVPEAQLDWED